MRLLSIIRGLRVTWPLRSSTVALILVAVGLTLIGDPRRIREVGFAALLPMRAEALDITSPRDASTVGDGDLVLIEGTAVDPSDGDPDRVEIAIDGSTSWTAADLDTRQPGRWKFVWTDPQPGLHRIAARSFNDDGTPRVQQNIQVQVAANASSSAFIVENPYSIPGSYRKGQLHMHTTGSFDGWKSLSPAEDALEYKRRGYQFVVITDHDTVSYPKDVNDDSFITIPGFESTSEAGHITASFTTKTVSPEMAPQARIDGITSGGGLAILAHPDWRVGWTRNDFKNLHGYFAFEIFNGITTTTPAQQERDEQLWTQSLNAKRRSDRMWAVAVDDSHNPAEIDKGWVMVKAPQLTEAAIKKSLQRGAFYASNGPSFRVLGILQNQITASSRDAATIRFINQEGGVVAELPSDWAQYQPTSADRWIRVEAVTADGRKAWSQPFWITPASPRMAGGGSISSPM